MVCDDDSDPYLVVRDWWNSEGNSYKTPRQHLFKELGATTAPSQRIGKGWLYWLQDNPALYAANAQEESRLIDLVRNAAEKTAVKWREASFLLLRRGAYVIASGLDESIAEAPKALTGRFINLFDPDLRVQRSITLHPASRYYLVDLDRTPKRDGTILASACKVLPTKEHSFIVEGIAATPAIILFASERSPKRILLGHEEIKTFEHLADEKLLWIKFQNRAEPRTLQMIF